MIYLKTLRIVRFGTLCDREINLQPGMNVLVGDNESGKSTAADFIRYIFYGFGDKSEKEQRMPADGSPAEGAVDFVSDGRELRAERFTSASAEKAQVTDALTGEIVHSGAGIGEKYFGLPRDVYANTAYFRQAGGGIVDGRDICEAIDNLLFGADETVDTAKALKRLDEARVALWHKNKKGGKIFELEKEKEKLLARRDAAAEASREIITLTGQLAETKDKLNAASERGALLSAQLDAYRLDERRKRAENLKLLADRLKTAELRVSDAEKLFAPGDDSARALLSLRERTDAMRAEIRTLDEALSDLSDGTEGDDIIFSRKVAEAGGEQEVQNSLVSVRKRVIQSHAVSAVSGVLTVISAILSLVFLKQGQTTLLFIAAACFVLFLALLITCHLKAVHARRRRKDFLEFFLSDSFQELSHRLSHAKKDTVYAEISRLQRELTEKRAALSEKNMAEERISSHLGFSSTQEALAELAVREKELISLRNEADKQKALYENAKSVLSDVKPDAAETASAMTLPADFDAAEAEKEYRFMTKAAEALRERAHRYEVRLAELGASAESPAGLTEQLRALDSRIALCKSRYDAYILAYQTLSVAGDEFRNSIAPRLSSDAGKFMELLTGGKYDSIGVDSSFALRYKDPAGARTLSVSAMSQGTRDAAYLSLRLALLKLLCKSDLPPIVFDESFVYYDDHRLALTIRALASLPDVQMILLSASKREDAAYTGLRG